jgi:hypothetical protein
MFLSLKPDKRGYWTSSIVPMASCKETQKKRGVTSQSHTAPIRALV